jgi:carboxypeptidase Taq
MSTPKAYDQLLEHFTSIHHLSSVMELLNWDQEVNMPKGGAAKRGDELAAVQTVIHQKSTDPRIAEWADSLENQSTDLTEAQQADVREAKKAFERETKVPAKLVAALAKETVLSTEAWAKARKENDFQQFLPSLTRTLELKREFADAIRGEKSRYDVLLDEYEPNETSAYLRELFGRMRPKLVSLLDKIKGSSHPTDPAKIRGEFSEAKQAQLCRNVIEKMGFSFQEGRLDTSTHPFCSGMASDVRLTTRYDDDSIEQALFGCMHEAGHGLYEQGMDRNRIGAPANTFASLGLHESQSRFWENMIGRSEAFWHTFYPELQQAFPSPFQQLSLNEFWRNINHVTPSFIRTESDEVTYNLHIILRFEIELGLVEGTLSAADLPEVWNQRFTDSFGITPANDGEGCLQDIHWAAGLVGYFPTYALGNLYAAQLYNTINQHIDIEESLKRGELLPIRDWLIEHVHQPGRIKYARDLMESVNGTPLHEDAFIDYINKKYATVYGF